MNKILYILIFSTLLFSSSDAEQGEVEYVIKPQFDGAWPFSEGLARVRMDNQPGYINKDGQVVINLKLLDGYGFGWWNFSEGLAPVYSTDSGYGYINREGQWVIKPQFDNAWSFSEGLACVGIGDRYGYINKEGQYVVNPQFDYARFFSEGLAAVKIGDKYGYISKGSFDK